MYSEQKQANILTNTNESSIYLSHLILHTFYNIIFVSSWIYLYSKCSGVFNLRRNFVRFTILHKLNQRGLFFLLDIISHWELGAPIWKYAPSIGLQNLDFDKWKRFIGSLQAARLSYNRDGDRIIWDDPLQENDILVHELYLEIINEQIED